MTRYLILIAATRTGFSAHVPDLPGCIAAGRTLKEVTQRMARAIEMHLAAMREDGDDIPEPSRVELVEVAGRRNLRSTSARLLARREFAVAPERCVLSRVGLDLSSAIAVEVSRELLEAAIGGLSKPCLTLCGELRDDADTILKTDGAVGQTTVREDQGHFIVQNIGNGVALNVSYSFRSLAQPDTRNRRGYLQNVLTNQRISMAELVTAFHGEYEVSFLFQSIGGRQYRTAVTINARVITAFVFERV